MIPGHRLQGTGNAKVLVLPGWFGDETLLDPVLSYLNLHDRSYATLAYRGYGASRSTPGSFTLEEIADDALRLVDALQWHRFAILGHSMGAKAAQIVALRAPARVCGIAALTPVPAQAVPFDPEAWDLFSGAAKDISRRAAIIEMSTGNRLTRTWSDALARRSAARCDAHAFRTYLDAWAKTDIAAAVTGSLLPLLALVGEHDPQLTEQVMRSTYLTSYPRARVTVIGNAGHYPIEETPIAFVTQLEDFLATLS